MVETKEKLTQGQITQAVVKYIVQAATWPNKVSGKIEIKDGELLEDQHYVLEDETGEHVVYGNLLDVAAESIETDSLQRCIIGNLDKYELSKLRVEGNVRSTDGSTLCIDVLTIRDKGYMNPVRSKEGFLAIASTIADQIKYQYAGVDRGFNVEKVVNRLYTAPEPKPE